MLEEQFVILSRAMNLTTTSHVSRLRGFVATGAATDSKSVNTA